MKANQYFVYIATNKSFTLYIGITNNLSRRTWQHKEKMAIGFTQKYNINKIIYCEIFDDPYNAISREKQIKKWSRKKKIDLKTCPPIILSAAICNFSARGGSAFGGGCKFFKAPPLILRINIVAYSKFSLEITSFRYEKLLRDKSLLKN